MVSNELPGILAHWWHLPRKHNSGIHTKAAYHTMNKFALDTILELVGDEMDALNDVFKLPQSELLEESLLNIKWKEMTVDVCHEAPTTWLLLHHTAYTQKQESQNTIRSPHTVSLCIV
jgi:hypothetical protein